tara:strand:- start:5880 stop:6515 length:636 start_codon:yes stop_codon:yes gene_type:complete
MILFLDTISPFPYFSIIEKNNIISSINILNKNNNKVSDCIIPAFLKLQKKTELKNNINKLIICTGPGSYTALRIGIIFMYGLSLSLNKPLIGVSGIDLLKLMPNKKNDNIINYFIISSNDQNFFCGTNKLKKSFIKKIESNELMDFKNKSGFKIVFSNYEINLKIKKFFKIKKNQKMAFKNIISANYDKVLSIKQKKIIEPIYISNNKILN